MATREKPGTPGVVHTDNRPRQERIASVTVGGVDYSANLIAVKL